jgi:site-specific DNA-methyltransferase (adenine-specific)
VKPYYDHAGITIYHGDCREILTRLAFDSFITDPPYGVNFAGKSTKYTAASGGYTTVDDVDAGPQAVALALSCVDRGAVFSGIRLMFKYPEPRDVGCVYCPSGAGRGPWGFTCFNPILFYGKRPGGPKSPSSIQSFATSDNLGGHPCAKPVRWLSWLVGLVSLDTDVVVDPFMGSGTTLRAAKDLGRRAIGIEIEERYCEIAAKRLCQEVLPL